MNLAAHPDRPDIGHVVTGWNRPLSTYFVQAIGVDGTTVMFWRGTRMGELDAPAAAALARPFAEIPDDLVDKLKEARMLEAGEVDGLVQQLLKRSGVIR